MKGNEARVVFFLHPLNQLKDGQVSRVQPLRSSFGVTFLFLLGLLLGLGVLVYVLLQFGVLTISKEEPRRLFHMVSFNYNGDFRTLAVGGYDGYNELNTVEEWKPETESWSTVETRLKEKRRAFGAVAVNKNLVCPSH